MNKFLGLAIKKVQKLLVPWNKYKTDKQFQVLKSLKKQKILMFVNDGRKSKHRMERKLAR